MILKIKVVTYHDGLMTSWTIIPRVSKIKWEEDLKPIENAPLCIPPDEWGSEIGNNKFTEGYPVDLTVYGPLFKEQCPPPYGDHIMALDVTYSLENNSQLYVARLTVPHSGLRPEAYLCNDEGKTIEKIH